MNWEDLHFFMKTAQLGSLADAAGELGVDATTVSRRVSALEQSLNTRLFNRKASNWTLTAAGERVLRAASEMSSQTNAIKRIAFAESENVQGEIRITSGGEFMRVFLAPIVWAFCELNPKISVRMISASASLNLDRREADIAFRTVETPPQDVVARKIADIGFAVYGHHDLIEKGRLQELPIVTWINESDEPPKWSESVVPNAQVIHRVNRQALMLDAVVSGAGLALLPCCLGDPEPMLRRTPGEHVWPTAPLWMLYHTDARKNPRLRAFRGFVEDALKLKRANLERGGLKHAS